MILPQTETMKPTVIVVMVVIGMARLGQAYNTNAPSFWGTPNATASATGYVPTFSSTHTETFAGTQTSVGTPTQGTNAPSASTLRPSETATATCCGSKGSLSVTASQPTQHTATWTPTWAPTQKMTLGPSKTAVMQTSLTQSPEVSSSTFSPKGSHTVLASQTTLGRATKTNTWTHAQETTSRPSDTAIVDASSSQSPKVIDTTSSPSGVIPSQKTSSHTSTAIHTASSSPATSINPPSKTNTASPLVTTPTFGYQAFVHLCLNHAGSLRYDTYPLYTLQRLVKEDIEDALPAGIEVTLESRETVNSILQLHMCITVCQGLLNRPLKSALSSLYDQVLDTNSQLRQGQVTKYLQYEMRSISFKELSPVKIHPSVIEHKIENWSENIDLRLSISNNNSCSVEIREVTMNAEYPAKCSDSEKDWLRLQTMLPVNIPTGEARSLTFVLYSKCLKSYENQLAVADLQIKLSTELYPPTVPVRILLPKTGNKKGDSDADWSQNLDWKAYSILAGLVFAFLVCFCCVIRSVRHRCTTCFSKICCRCCRKERYQNLESRESDDYDRDDFPEYKDTGATLELSAMSTSDTSSKNEISLLEDIAMEPEEFEKCWSKYPTM